VACLEPQVRLTTYLRTALFGSMVVSVASSALIAQLVAEGSGAALAFLTTNAFATFFLAGLLFFDALLVAALGVVAFVAAGSFHGLGAVELAYCGTLLALVVAVGTYIAHGVEESNRRFFLERGRLGDLAERDGLTGLRNRRAFDEHLVRVWQQSLRDRSAIAVLMIDLDHFKSYNDSYGHQAGDACLRHVAQLVQGFARRPLDVAARYGGEELAIVLYQVTSRARTRRRRAAARQRRGGAHRASRGAGAWSGDGQHGGSPGWRLRSSARPKRPCGSPIRRCMRPSSGAATSCAS
jgi:GGDEF domain-containing protein